MGVFMCPECTLERAWIKEEPANVSLKEFHSNPKYMQVEGKHIRTEIVDILELNSQKGWCCYEIKISKSDFHSRAIKSFVGEYNYYLMPDELYEQVKKELDKETFAQQVTAVVLYGNTVMLDVIFRDGYSKNSPQIKCKCIYKGRGQGKQEWGAEKRKRVLCA